MRIWQFLIYVLLIFFILRLLRKLWQAGRPRFRERSKQEKQPYQDKDVMEVKFTELPPEETDAPESSDKEKSK